MTAPRPLSWEAGTSGTRGTSSLFSLARDVHERYRSRHAAWYPTRYRGRLGVGGPGTDLLWVRGTRYQPGTRFARADLRGTGSTGSTADSTNGRRPQ